MNIYGKTDIGLVRETNQDAYASCAVTEDVLWAVVCDGMGGANGGNIAAEIAVNRIAEQMQSGVRPGMKEQSVQSLMIGAIENANLSIYRRAAEEPELTGMGTTVVLALVLGNRGYVAHVGDSRAYLISPHACMQITTDHSMVQMMVELGKITEDEARIHPNKNVITRALGIEAHVDVDYKSYAHAEDEILLLCSDGLTNFLGAEEIAGITLGHELSSVPGLLVERANQGGGGDNITAVVIGRN